MLIQITEDRRLTSDENQFILQKRTYSEKHDQYKWVSYKYYGNFQTALQSIADQLLKEFNVQGYESCLTYIKEVKKVLKEDY